uniref:Uncharacterized protein n=1 Tax=Arundo donax TaxID=35708 RepID=A0A0A9B1H7_ARUDO
MSIYNWKVKRTTLMFCTAATASYTSNVPFNICGVQWQP